MEKPKSKKRCNSRNKVLKKWLPGGRDYTDLYSQSVMVSGMVKEPEDLIDRDLINLLKYIKDMKIPE